MLIKQILIVFYFIKINQFQNNITENNNNTNITTVNNNTTTNTNNNTTNVNNNTNNEDIIINNKIDCTIDVNCLSCKNKKCLVCNPKNFSILNDKGECTSIDSNKIPNCKIIDFNLNCKECEGEYLLYNNKCYFFNQNSNFRVNDCVVYEMISENLIMCKYCKEKFYLSNNKCYSLIDYIDGCLYYFNSINCIKCRENYFLYNWKCIEYININGCLVYEGKNSFCKNCLMPTIDNIYITNENVVNDDLLKNINNNIYSFLKNTNIKFDNSELNFINILNNNYCKKKQFFNCKKLNNNNCTECIEGYYLNQNLCVKLSYPKIDNCLNYSNQFTCILCKDGYYLNNNICTLRINTANCQTYALDRDQCTKCKIYYSLSNFNCENLGPNPIRTDNCIETSADGNTCINCSNNYVILQNNCYPAIPNCLNNILNQGIIACNSCNNNLGFYLSNFSCLISSVESCYKVNVAGICLGCTNFKILSNDFNKCNYNTDKNNCLNTDLVNGNQICSKCQENFIKFQGQYCKSKAENCLIYNNLTDQCNVCNGLYIRDNGVDCNLNDSSINNCLRLNNITRRCEQCMENYYVNGGNCSSSAQNDDCIKQEFVNNSLKCVKCKLINNIQYYPHSINKCSNIKLTNNNCNSPTILKNIGKTYKFCNKIINFDYTTSNCLIMSNNFCFKCRNGYILNDNKTNCIDIANCQKLNDKRVGCINCNENYTLGPSFNCFLNTAGANKRNYSENCSNPVEVDINGQLYLLCYKCNSGYVLKDFQNNLGSNFFYYNNKTKTKLKVNDNNDVIEDEEKNIHLIIGTCVNENLIKKDNTTLESNSYLRSLVRIINQNDLVLICKVGYIFNETLKNCESLNIRNNEFYLFQTNVSNIFKEYFYCPNNQYLTIYNQNNNVKIKCLMSGASNINQVNIFNKNCLIYIHDGTANSNNTTCFVCKRFFYTNNSYNCLNYINNCKTLNNKLGSNINNGCSNCLYFKNINNYCSNIQQNAEINNCEIFFNENNCFKCKSGYKIYFVNINGTNLLSCKKLYINDDNCYVFQNNSCNACKDSYSLLNIDSLDDMKVCANKINSFNNCLEIDTNNNCINCFNGYTWDENLKNCTFKIENCIRAKNYFLKTCEVCINEYYTDNGICKKGSINGCSTYRDKNNCSKCKKYYYLYTNSITKKDLCFYINNNSNIFEYKTDSIFNGTIQVNCLNTRMPINKIICVNKFNYNCSINDSLAINSLNKILCSSCNNINKFYYNQILDKCLIRNSIKNCKTYNASSNTCNICETGYFVNSSKLNCYKNPELSSNCRKYNNNLTCLECKREYYLESNKCILINYENWTLNCDLYNKNGNIIQCNRCIIDYFLEASKCIKIEFDDFLRNCKFPYKSKSECECNLGYYFNITKKKCDSIENCINYERVTNENTDESKIICTKCLDKYYVDTKSNMCLKIEEKNSNNCLEFNSNGFCKNCDISNGYYLVNGYCEKILKSIKNCGDYKNGSKCVLCKNGYYLSKNGNCLRCLEGCRICNQKRECLLCYENFYQKYENLCTRILIQNNFQNTEAMKKIQTVILATFLWFFI